MKVRAEERRISRVQGLLIFLLEVNIHQPMLKVVLL